MSQRIDDLKTSLTEAAMRLNVARAALHEAYISESGLTPGKVVLHAGKRFLVTDEERMNKTIASLTRPEIASEE